MKSAGFFLIVGKDSEAEKKHYFGKTPVSIGRDEKNDLELDDYSVSAEHARIFSEEGGVFIEDLGSTNGIRRGGELLDASFRLSRQSLSELRPEISDDAFFGRLENLEGKEFGSRGDFENTLRNAVRAEEDVISVISKKAFRKGRPMALRDGMSFSVGEVAIRYEGFVGLSLVLIKGGKVGRAFPLDKKGVRIGRKTSGENDICISNRTVSGEHAEIFFDKEKGDFFLKDIRSTNGTYCKGKNLKGDEKGILIREGDEFSLGEASSEVVFRVERKTPVHGSGGKTVILDDSYMGGGSSVPLMPIAIGIGATLLVVILIVLYICMR